MVAIYVDDKDRTSQLRDWKIRKVGAAGDLKLECRFHSGKSCSFPLSQCRIEPTEVVEGQLLGKRGDTQRRLVERAVIYGGKHIVVQYPGNPEKYLMNADGVEFFPVVEHRPVFRYFVDVAKARAEKADDPAIADNVLRQLNALRPDPDTALDAYCSGRNQRREKHGDLIYPFGVNQSQLAAVERAFESQVSLIEGPPGTGKTQTILNIVSNILLRGKTVAILSNNNAAVSNVYEKLEKNHLGYLVAKLGNAENRKAFFDSTVALPSESAGAAPTMQHVQAVLGKLKRLLDAQNAVARLQAEIDELVIEQRYLAQWRRDNDVPASVALDGYRLSPRKTTDLMAYLAYLDERRIRFRDRIELLLNFRILRASPFGEGEKRKAMIYALQFHYYEQALKDKRLALSAHLRELDMGHFDALLGELVASSMAHLKAHLLRHIQAGEVFGDDNYRSNFDAFVKRYPVIGSSTHSIVNSVGPGVVMDYVIIDEASQLDIVPGVLALGCARNLIIVGDRKQLPHIPAKLGVAPPAEHYDCDKYSLLDSCIKVFNGSVPMTLLQEHYRCHPRIIQFCNQQFYGNQLIPMTKDEGEDALKLVVTAKGNHARGNKNQRELDSILKTIEWDGEGNLSADGTRGFIAPYNAQVELSRSRLPADFVKETVHKFQGRECDEIVFSTVLDKKASNQGRLDFVDDPHLINVAVSRAKKQFTLVTGDDVFAANYGHIAALVRYMKYYADEESVHLAPVVSAFDLLYSEYDQSLEGLRARLRPDDSRFKSEQIVAAILRDALTQVAFQAMTFHSQVALTQVVSMNNPEFTPDEVSFMRHRASCDFVVYFRVGKTPLGVIEVDGASHEEPDQIRRDTLKNGILLKCGIPLLRLKTIDSDIEMNVAKFLSRWAGGAGSH